MAILKLLSEEVCNCGPPSRQPEIDQRLPSPLASPLAPPLSPCVPPLFLPLLAPPFPEGVCRRARGAQFGLQQRNEQMGLRYWPGAWKLKLEDGGRSPRCAHDLIRAPGGLAVCVFVFAVPCRSSPADRGRAWAQRAPRLLGGRAYTSPCAAIGKAPPVALRDLRRSGPPGWAAALHPFQPWLPRPGFHIDFNRALCRAGV
jgi:hypothetical protein